MALVGIGLARAMGRRYMRRIETANALLEQRPPNGPLNSNWRSADCAPLTSGSCGKKNALARRIDERDCP
ncbi:MAG: hypothetical protein ABIQ12_06320 [Opitutaceae bacterium]